MAIEHWIGFGIIVATILGALGNTIGPSIAALVQHRLAQKTDGEAKPTTIAERLYNWLGLPIFDWVPRIVVVVSAYMLYRELSSSEPLTRASVFTISVYVASIAGNFIFFLVGRIIDNILEIQRSTASVLGRHVEVTQELSRQIFGVSEHPVEENKVPKVGTPKKKRSTGLVKVDKDKQA